MSDPKPTIYEADPHTRAKHRILKAYLERWLPILDRQAQVVKRAKHRLLYVDGFAGAGEYEDSVPGSPLIPIETAMGHSHQFSCPIEIRLIEKRPDRVNHLKNLIKAKKATLVGNANLVIPDPIEGDCEQEVRNLVTACVRSGQPLGPAFFFLDQFGYSSFSMANRNGGISSVAM
ncbi:three-Cys-motif partner protein TcmP [Leptolyngbya sp. 7M]|uniref:three-Cys-motif partner protein TcmP n=1 Tax=Leptolyngbya sp. 7M TaxID=2812896 RepID=UPI001B8B87DF|nr:three-Cys-motif partner protein TcmP [Leptolyngbya sp. 7M]QYO65097.1 three-Cys-motif partner protein TcmP [Leptolyngbya sp. 7M]